jgi:hypothetical protein
LNAILATAYSHIGKSAPVSSMFRVGDVRGAHGGSIMQAMIAVAGLTPALQTRELSKVLQQLKADAETSRCLVLLSHYDATPMKCAFGVHASQLIPIARFFPTGMRRTIDGKLYARRGSARSRNVVCPTVVCWRCTSSAWRCAGSLAKACTSRAIWRLHASCQISGHLH